MLQIVLKFYNVKHDKHDSMFRKFIKKKSSEETIFEWNKTSSFREDEKRESFAFIRWNEEK